MFHRVLWKCSKILPNILANSIVIRSADNVLSLGLFMDETMFLLCTCQVQKVCSKVISRLRSLWPNSYGLPSKIRLMLLKSLTVPTFTYAECIYTTNLSVSDIKWYTALWQFLWVYLWCLSTALITITDHSSFEPYRIQ